MLSSAVRLDNVNKVIKLEKMVLLDITNLQYRNFFSLKG